VGNPGIITFDGGPVIEPDTPIAGTFPMVPNGEVLYSVRAFNNADDPGGSTNDTDQIVTLRALGKVRGEEKVLELNLLATTGLRLINCEGERGVDPCPDVVNGNPQIDPMDGREPASSPELPALPPLADPLNPSDCNSANFYCNSGNFPWMSVQTFTGDIEMTNTPQQPNDVLVASNTYYFTTGNVSIKQVTGVSHVAVVSLGEVSVSTGTDIDHVFLASHERMVLHGGIDLFGYQADPVDPKQFPTIIAGSIIQQGSNVVNISGALFSWGEVDLNPINVEGVIIGNPVEIQGTSAEYGDNGNINYYGFLEGFDYPDDLKTTSGIPGTWTEIE